VVDDSTLKALDFPKVLDLLSRYTQTEMGRRRALELRPLGDVRALEGVFNQTDELFQLDKEPPLGMVADLEPVLTAQLFMPKELLVIAKTLRAIMETKTLFDDSKHLAPLVAQRLASIPNFRDIIRTIERTIEEPGQVSDSASPQLNRLRKEIRRKRQTIINQLEGFVRDEPEKFQDPVVTIRGGRYVLPMKAEAQSGFSGIVHESSSKGKTLFVEPSTSVAEQNDLAVALSDELEEVERILTSLTQEVRLFETEIARALEIIAELDLLYARKGFAQSCKGIRPKIAANGALEIKNGRHPLLLLAKKDVIPLNLSLNSDKTVLLISGPNAGGKTVVLKTIGIFALMLAAGIYLPADAGTELPFYNGVYADIGDESSIEQGLSSFSASLLNIKSILRQATGQSLVLLDELGGSTSPQEGSALSIAILEDLKNRGVRSLATSHLEPLKFFVQGSTGMVNGAMEFKNGPTYRLIPNQIGESNALAVANSLGFSASLLEHARSYLDQDWLKLTERLNTLQTEIEETHKLKTDLTGKNQELETLIRDYSGKLSQFSRFQRQEQERFTSEQKKLLTETRREIERLVKEIREREATSETIRSAKGFIQKRLDELKKPEPAGEPATPLEPGDSVHSQTFKRKGEVIQIVGDEVLVQFGSLKLFVKPEDLTRLEAGLTRLKAGLGPSEAERQPQPEPEISKEDFNSNLSIRGLDSLEAEEKLVRFLDLAQFHGVKRVFIIHGKGGGILRRLVREFLKNDTRVQDFHLGEFFEGGSGITVVNLR
jgi:DNA mismatch repair protein MutS2